MNTRSNKTIVREDPKKSEERVRDHLRKRLVEMIRRNESVRRDKTQ